MFIEEHIAGGLFRGHLAEIDRRGFTVFSSQHHKPAAADITGLRMRHRQRIANGNRCINGVAALAQNIYADAGGQRIHRGYHPLLGAHRVKHIFLNAIRDRRRGRRIGGDGKAAPRQ